MSPEASAGRVQEDRYRRSIQLCSVANNIIYYYYYAYYPFLCAYRTHNNIQLGTLYYCIYIIIFFYTINQQNYNIQTHIRLTYLLFFFVEFLLCSCSGLQKHICIIYYIARVHRGSR